MMEKIGGERVAVVFSNPGRTAFSGFGKMVIIGLVFFFTSAFAQAALFELTLDSQGLNKINTYDFYTWSNEVPWEVSQSTLANNIFYNLICALNDDPNTIGMHLLDVQENNGYTYNLGFVLTATFNANEKMKLSQGSGGAEFQSEPLNSLKKSGIPVLSSSSAAVTNPDTAPKRAVVPEPVTLVILALAAPFIYAKRRPGIAHP